MNFKVTIRIALFFLTFILLKSLCTSGEDAAYWNSKGMEYYSKKNYEKAVNCYNKALELDPKSYQIMNNKAAALLVWGKTENNKDYVEKSVDIYEKSLKINPDSKMAWYGKGLALAYLGRYKEAIKSYDKALEIDPKDNDIKKAKKDAQKELASIKPTPSPTAVAVVSPTPTIVISKTPPAERNMALIPGGTFQMGGNDAIEKPVHKVTVSSFYMGKYEVTNSEYWNFLNACGNQTEGGKRWVAFSLSECNSYMERSSGLIEKDGSYLVKPGYENRPVVYVTWFGAVAYCNWLSSVDGLDNSYGDAGSRGNVDITKKGYRLPTEAEWEYSSRSGTNTEYHWGNNMDNAYCYHEGSSDDKHHPVGEKLPNGFGLHDMSGNVWEWCNDWYGNYEPNPQTNPIGPVTIFFHYRIIRGGSWGSNLLDCRSAKRGTLAPDGCNGLLGFRIVRTP